MVSWSAIAHCATPHDCLAIGSVGLWLNGVMLRRGKKDGQSVFAPKEGQSSPLRSSKSPSDCSSFGFINSIATEDEALKHLAEILVESFLLQKQYGNTKQQ